MNSPREIQFKKYDAEYYRNLRETHKTKKQKEQQIKTQQIKKNNHNQQIKRTNQINSIPLKRQNNFFTRQTKPLPLNNTQDQTIKKTSKGNIKNTNLDNTQKYEKFHENKKSNTKVQKKDKQKGNKKFEDLSQQQLDAQRRIFLRHKKNSSAEELRQIKQYKSNLKGKVKFNQKKLVQQLSPNNKKTTSSNKNRSPSILKNKNKKRINRLKSLPNNNFQNQMPSQQTSIDVKENYLQKEKKLNLVTKNKYYSILENLQQKYLKENPNKKLNHNLNQKQNKQQYRNIKETYKYADPYFTPTQSSLFVSLQEINKTKRDKQIIWVRISQLFPDYQLVVIKEEFQFSRLKIKNQSSQTSYCAKHIPSIFNGIQNCRDLLANIFELSKTYNKFGVYILKVYHQHAWKYKIIDDKIPVIVKSKKYQNINSFNTNSKYIPAFLNVQIQKQNDKKQLQIWPFLLQKAYASFYSSYEALQYGNAIDFVYEVTGTPPQQVLFSQNKNQIISMIKNHLFLQNSFALGQTQQSYPYTPLTKKIIKPKQKQNMKIQNMQTLISFDPNNQYSQVNLPFAKLPTLFNKLYLVKYQKFPYQITSILGRYNNIVKAQRSQVSLRMIKVQNSCQCLISICQKDQKLYCSSSILYQYIWIRVILVSKELNGNYRWINGRYSNKKSISFRQFLTSGQYYLIVMPQWRSIHCHQMTILINSNQKITMEKANYSKHSRMIQKSCLDLAQRYGNLHQINTFICSYNYLSRQVGFIIQNINNQRMTGSIKVIRSINGLKAKVQLVPVNLQFYELSTEDKKKGVIKYKNTIQVLIPKSDSYTVVIKMKGGIDHNFFNVFDFGN